MFPCFIPEPSLYAHSRGTEEFCGVTGQVDIINSTLGKALGGASGGYTTGPRELIDLLRQRSRPYLFSNTLPPPVVAGASKVTHQEGMRLKIIGRLYFIFPQCIHYQSFISRERERCLGGGGGGGASVGFGYDNWHV